MLPFYYTFLILVLSSSVTAMPPPPPLPPQSLPLQSVDDKSGFLLHNDNVRLSDKLWARVEIAVSGGIPDTWTQARSIPAKWAKVLSLDDVIHFVDGTSDSGVEYVYLRRVKRTWRPKEPKRKGLIKKPEDLKLNTYRVWRPGYIPPRPAHTDPLLGPLHIEKCRLYLDDTYWGRNWEILGKVGESLMFEILTTCLTMRFTGIFGPKRSLKGGYTHQMDVHSSVRCGGPACDLYFTRSTRT